VPIVNPDYADALVAQHAKPGATLLAVLHGIQHEVGYVPPEVVAPLGRALNLSRAEVHGVITYYPHFRRTPPAPVTIQVCRAEACQSVGGEQLVQHIEQSTGCRFSKPHAAAHDTAAAHNEVELESVYCLGQCASSPALMINQRLHARVTPEKFDALFAAAMAQVGAAAETGSDALEHAGSAS